MNRVSLLLIGILWFQVYVVFGQRKDILLNKNWKFRFSHQVDKNSSRRVDLPHTWNTEDALSGKTDYKRGIGNYEKSLYIEPEWEGKRLFLRFEGANSVANVFVNHRHVGEHRGGYGAFIFEITDFVKYGEQNPVLVRVNNGEQLDVMPLVGDFNFYGGIYRNVHLLVTEKVCVSPLDYASSGVYLEQQVVNEKEAEVLARIHLSNKGEAQEIGLRVVVKDNHRVISQEEKNIYLNQGEDSQESIALHISHPHLWNGREDPFMYDVEVEVIRGGRVTDRVVQPLGLRYYRTDPAEGFFLNGKHLALRGVCRHQDRAGVGNALSREHHEEDVALLLEMGANAVRLAHYPHATEVYDLMDKYGIVVWAEIPFVGPGGYADKGFVDLPSFRYNGKEQLKELIRQHYNHPSVCFWGLFNELKEYGDNPVEYVKELNELAHAEDPTRPTTSASNQGGALNLITDHIAWNRYDGWYGGTPANLGKWLDRTHQSNPELKIGISEYGAGASIYHQQDTLVQTNPGSWWHPENWQTWYHMENWKVIAARPYIWGTFVWNMFDFGAAHRTEGERPGINDKGLVTFDRKVRKDAFYFYKANWNKKEPMLYLAEKRNRHRLHPLQHFIAFTTAREAELFVNGKSCGKHKTDSYATVEWKDIPLKTGENHIKVVATDKRPLKDEVIVYLE
ncbi:glycoside hydrolase family 2 TIM barrel-domain containing protein [Odoribacter sp. Z80]|uniref:beta-glucuronidase LacZ4 n=1 Tax=Odoribacter sp. Z80 TaxID=2304575 RepID=UPI00137B830D|nr:glycoside hydrolase family 2 TIM barrel-domain containing protein [Odoribacter sp. Z80]NCE71431.1 glycoside hydrolase family 2 protein [Odoribacter sp. Z80]